VHVGPSTTWGIVLCYCLYWVGGIVTGGICPVTDVSIPFRKYSQKELVPANKQFSEHVNVRGNYMERLGDNPSRHAVSDKDY